MAKCFYCGKPRARYEVDDYYFGRKKLCAACEREWAKENNEQQKEWAAMGKRF